MNVPQGSDLGAISMGDLLDSVEAVKPLRRGDVVDGVVMRATSEGILINVGQKSEGQVPINEMRTIGRDGQEAPQVGDTVVVVVLKGESGENPALLSIDKATGERGWRILQTALEKDEMVEAVVVGFNRGGVLVETLGIQGFIPVSQVVSVTRGEFERAVGPRRTESERSDKSQNEDAFEIIGENDSNGESGSGLESTQDTDQGVHDANDQNVTEHNGDNDSIGLKLKLKVLEVNRNRNRVILSELQSVQKQRDEQKDRLIEELKEGEVRSGNVTGISNFGAFVDLGGADGLIHISELSWTPVGSPEDIIKVGEVVEVQVLRIDPENRKIALSMKRLHPEPWQTIEEVHKVGDVVDATITKLTDFGAFARVDGSVEGLIHISELTDRMVRHPREVVKEGDKVKLTVLRIEPERRRLGLSLKQTDQEQ